jgi:hypothetical protein
VAVITYLMGQAMANLLPRKGWLGRLINPGPVGVVIISLTLSSDAAYEDKSNSITFFIANSVKV